VSPGAQSPFCPIIGMTGVLFHEMHVLAFAVRRCILYAKQAGPADGVRSKAMDGSVSSTGCGCCWGRDVVLRALGASGQDRHMLLRTLSRLRPPVCRRMRNMPTGIARRRLSPYNRRPCSRWTCDWPEDFRHHRDRRP